MDRSGSRIEENQVEKKHRELNGIWVLSAFIGIWNT